MSHPMPTSTESKSPDCWPQPAEQIFSADQVAQAWDAVAAGVLKTLHQSGRRQPLIALTVMNGGLFPLVELCRRLPVALEVDYVHATRYRNQTRGGAIEWRYWPTRDFGDSTVLLIDDIFDEGYTLEAVDQRLRTQTDNIYRIVLARKLHERGLERGWVDFHGLDLPDRFVFGCGMDIQGQWRHLESIWALK